MNSSRFSISNAMGSPLAKFKDAAQRAKRFAPAFNSA
mgnify:CR=1 FL=1